jgi:hypothetical protein
MQFRRLTTEELSALEEDFVKFLASNSVTGDDWEKIKSTKPEKVDELIEVFSNIVWEKVLTKATHLEHRSRKELKVFFCGREKLVVMGLSADPNSDIDLTDPACIERLATEPAGGFKILSSYKDYSKSREEELFEMVESGCLVTDDSLFLTLSALYAKSKTAS